jgi:type VI protein secretion system component Hcp
MASNITLLIQGFPASAEPLVVEPLCYSWGVEVPIIIDGAAGGAFPGRPDLSPLSLTKAADATSLELFQAAMTGRRFASATLTVDPANGSNPVIYQFTDVLISGMKFLGSHGEAPVEELVLTFATASLL